MAFIPRSEWGLPATWPNRRVDPSRRTGFVVHWDGGPNPDDAADEIRLLLAYHRYHLHTTKTGGFDYNLAVGPITGNIYEGRGLDVVGAHAGGANTPNIGVILIGGPGNLTEKGQQGLRDAYALACKHTGRQLRQLAHRDVNRTGCPGDDIAAWVHAGGLSGGTVPAGGGSTGGPRFRPGDITVGVSVKQVQERLVAHGYNVGPHGIDNDMGTDTISAIRSFQDDQGIDVDGIVGPDTWGRLSAKPGTAKPTGLKAPAFPLPNDDWYFGPKSGPKQSVSGYYSHRSDLRRWQQRMKDRGWDINPDGLYGPQTRSIAVAFQKEKRLRVDGLIGASTWAAAWTEPVT
ncbi:N-acetylmuramoyl-L-alanine amidase [Microbacterium sp. Mu-80]|uniref:N-acetylmuramoyl-L-alanine amidase n=1 Tax=Microbacterium bandirmense TaxID=3122050 RepID=A0ABU8L8U0_9MICO